MFLREHVILQYYFETIIYSPYVFTKNTNINFKIIISVSFQH